MFAFIRKLDGRKRVLSVKGYITSWTGNVLAWEIHGAYLFETRVGMNDGTHTCGDNKEEVDKTSFVRFLSYVPASFYFFLDSSSVFFVKLASSTVFLMWVSPVPIPYECCGCQFLSLSHTLSAFSNLTCSSPGRTFCSSFTWDVVLHTHTHKQQSQSQTQIHTHRHEQNPHWESTSQRNHIRNTWK